MFRFVYCLCNIFILVSSNTLQHIPYRILLGPQGPVSSRITSQCNSCDTVKPNYETRTCGTPSNTHNRQGTCSSDPEIVNKILNHPALQCFTNKQCDTAKTELETPKIVNNYFIVSPDLLLNNKNNGNNIKETEMENSETVEKSQGESTKRQIINKQMLCDDEQSVRSHNSVHSVKRENKKLDPLRSCKNSKPEVRITRNPTDDAIVHNIKSRLPQIPEQLLRQVLTNMKSHVRYNYIDSLRHLPARYHHHFSCPFNQRYNSDIKRRKIYSNVRPIKKTSTSRVSSRSHQKTRKSKSSAHNHLKPKSERKSESRHDTKNSVLPSKENIILDGKNATAESKSKIKSTNTSSVKGIHKDIENDKGFKSSKKINATNKLPELSPELGNEDEITDLSDNYIDDYYPDFRQKDSLAKKKFYGSYSEYDDEEIQRAERKVSKHSSETPALEIREEIIFKSPPGLELPDFKTVKVNGKRTAHDNKRPIFKMNWDDSDSVDSKSETSADSTNKSESNNTVEKTEAKRGDIQTDFLKSRVVNYGILSKDDETKVKNVTSEENSDTTEYEEPDDTSVVVAKSYKY